MKETSRDSNLAGAFEKLIRGENWRDCLSDSNSEFWKSRFERWSLEMKSADTEAQSVFNTMSEGLVIQDGSGKIEKFNPETLRILGLNEDELLGRKSADPRWKAIREDGSPYRAEEHPAMIALKTKKSFRNGVMGLTLPSGEQRWIKVKAFLEKDQVVVQVIDSGQPISVAVEEKLFQPFFTTKPVGQGTGLGLSIARGILGSHGATIALNRDCPNTCFEIRFKSTIVKA